MSNKNSVITDDEHRLNAQKYNGLFLCPFYKRLYILNSFAHRSDCFCLTTGYDSRFSVYVKQKQS